MFLINLCWSWASTRYNRRSNQICSGKYIITYSSREDWELDAVKNWRRWSNRDHSKTHHSGFRFENRVPDSFPVKRQYDREKNSNSILYPTKIRGDHPANNRLTHFARYFYQSHTPLRSCMYVRVRYRLPQWITRGQRRRMNEQPERSPTYVLSLQMLRTLFHYLFHTYG